MVNTWLSASLALFAFAAAACSDSEDGPNLSHNPEGILRYGDFNEQAADELRAYPLGPLLWLGEEFEGFRLAHVDIRGITFPSGSGDMTTLIYGDCAGVKANPREPSCMSPLQIQIKPAGAMPPVETLKPSPPQPPL
jgi:hypothetical protein